jgi:hypothetical protein
MGTNTAIIPSSAPRPSLSERFPLRMLVFVAIVAVLLGYPMYVYLDSVMTGGIRDVGHGFKEVDLKAMSTFPFDQQAGTIEHVPAKWRALDGQKVVLYGEMWQPFEAGGGALAGFDLCYSIAKCCFSGPPQIQHFVKARVKPGRTLYYHPNQVKVTGVLHVSVEYDKEAGKVASVYQLDVEDVEPVR